MTHDYPVAETSRLTQLIVNPQCFDILQMAFFFTSTPAFYPFSTDAAFKGSNAKQPIFHLPTALLLPAGPAS